MRNDIFKQLLYGLQEVVTQLAEQLRSMGQASGGSQPNSHALHNLVAAYVSEAPRDAFSYVLECAFPAALYAKLTVC
jgi:hypothetical protein